MAKLLEVSRQSYMKYETGEVEPLVEVIRKLQKIYNIPYDVLIDNKVDFVDSETKDQHKPVTYDNVIFCGGITSECKSYPRRKTKQI